MGEWRVVGLLLTVAALTACAPPLPLPRATTVTTVIEQAPAPTTPARMDNDALSALVWQIVQRRLMEVPELAGYTLQVQGVSVVNESGNQYRGIAYVKPPMGEARAVELVVMYDGSDTLVRFADPSDFAFLDDLPTPR